MYYTEGYSQLAFQYASNQNVSDKNEHLLEGYYPRKKLLSSSKKKRYICRNLLFVGSEYSP
ncbi:MAG: hypothetical protein KatS3mg035_1334 [Bacteroidia bacterium]|nr:MAG: hypothetical protein KatS3mg035_1334 [Bacteroidia bacterium]